MIEFPLESEEDEECERCSWIAEFAISGGLQRATPALEPVTRPRDCVETLL